MDLLRMFLIWFGIVDENNYFSTNGYSEVGGNGSVHWKVISAVRGRAA